MTVAGFAAWLRATQHVILSCDPAKVPEESCVFGLPLIERATWATSRRTHPHQIDLSLFNIFRILCDETFHDKCEDAGSVIGQSFSWLRRRADRCHASIIARRHAHGGLELAREGTLIDESAGLADVSDTVVARQ